MKIPVPDPKWGLPDFPMVSPNMLRSYGVGGFELEQQEMPRGCPAQFKARYVDRVVKREDSFPLIYGRVLHEALQLREEEPVTAEDALMRVWDPRLSIDNFQEALDDLRGLEERESNPMDRYGTLATEERLWAELYVDEDYGPIYIQGIIDKIAVDFDTPGLVHVGDWKTNRQPPSIEQVMGDFQLMTYAWLVLRNWNRLVGPGPVGKVVVHLDAIKWRELPPVYFTAENLEAWHGWTVGIVRRILRDDKAKPVINEGCAYCPIRDTCPAYQAIPDLGAELMRVKPTRPDDEERPSPEELRQYADDLITWRDRANSMKLLLDKAVKEIDARFIDDAELLGRVVAGGYVWSQETNWVPEQDLRLLHDLTGDQFYDLVKTTKTALTAHTKGMPASEAEPIMKTLRSRPNGTTIKKTKGR